MLLTKEVEVSITHRNKKFYIEQGCKNVVVGNSIFVDLSKLPSSSGKKVKVDCDYCPEQYEIRFCDYARSKHVFIMKDACSKCWHKKRQDILYYRIENNDFDESDHRGYWVYPENIEKEVKEYIEKNGYIGKKDDKEQNLKWYMIHWALKKNNLKIEDVVSELGYNIEEIQQRKPNGYVMPFEELKEKIDSFVKEYGFFPDQKQLSKDLKFHNSDYQKHGTLAEIRDRLGYNDKKYLVDNRGFINKSSYELIVANYLIAQNIPYKREQYPFKKFDDKLNYRSDFTFFLPNKEIHVEVWGGMKTFNGQKELYDYDSVMKEKLRLYQLYNIEIISVTPDIFYNSMGVIKQKLYDIFSQYINLSFIQVKDRLVSTFTLHEMSDENLVEEIMKHSKFENILPSYDMLRKEKHEFLFKEVIKRYDNIFEFAKKYNLITAYEARSKKVVKQLTPTV